MSKYKNKEAECNRCRIKMINVIKSSKLYGSPFRIYWCKSCGALQIAEEKNNKTKLVFKLPEMTEDLPFDDDF